jgi:hypothetical protein
MFVKNIITSKNIMGFLVKVATSVEKDPMPAAAAISAALGVVLGIAIDKLVNKCDCSEEKGGTKGRKGGALSASPLFSPPEVKADDDELDSSGSNYKLYDQADANKADANKAAAEKADDKKAADDKASDDKAAAEKAAAEKASDDKAAAEKAAAEKADAEKAAAEKADAEKAAADKAAAEKAAAEKAAAEKAAAEKAAPPTCFKGDTLILMEDNTYKEISKIFKNDRLKLSDNNIGIVKVILKNELNRKTDMCFLDGFYVTPYHAIYKINKLSTDNDKEDWKYAVNIENNIKSKKFVDYVYNLHITTINGSLPNAGFVIKGLENNWAGTPFGQLINHPNVSNPFWKTCIVDILNILKDEINENGIFLLKYPEFMLLKNSEKTTYGIKYKNKTYILKNNKIVISDFFEKIPERN